MINLKNEPDKCETGQRAGDIQVFTSCSITAVFMKLIRVLVLAVVASRAGMYDSSHQHLEDFFESHLVLKSEALGASQGV